VIAIGLMSGTSADGIDAAAIELDVPAQSVRVLATESEPFPDPIRRAILAIAEGAPTGAAGIAQLHAQLGGRYASAASRLAARLPRAPDVIAVHGQTIAHLPDAHATLQIGNAAHVAQHTGVPTVSDFRSADIAEGGQGAPLVPFADHALFASLAPIAVLNIGGIANVTIIPTRDADDVIAFDTGPGNMVIDGVAALAGATHDADGAGALRGRVDDKTLSELLAHPYFERRAPKSTGREEFGRPFAARLVELTARHAQSHDDALATATALTARTIAAGIRRESDRSFARVLVAGGGARNPALLAMLAQQLAPADLEPTDAYGVPAAYREAIAFAILGAYRLRGLPNTLPRATCAAYTVSA
jgi:anhydro-N-acetylmuramic acid kinase